MKTFHLIYTAKIHQKLFDTTEIESGIILHMFKVNFINMRILFQIFEFLRLRTRIVCLTVEQFFFLKFDLVHVLILTITLFPFTPSKSVENEKNCTIHTCTKL